MLGRGRRLDDPQEANGGTKAPPYEYGCNLKQTCRGDHWSPAKIDKTQTKRAINDRPYGD